MIAFSLRRRTGTLTGVEHDHPALDDVVRLGLGLDAPARGLVRRVGGRPDHPAVDAHRLLALDRDVIAANGDLPATVHPDVAVPDVQLDVRRGVDVDVGGRGGDVDSVLDD